MCTSRTNDRLLGQMECYMDDLVDCFEEFLKKSMLVISVAVGTLVLMVMYVLKLMSERAASRGITRVTTANTECFHKFCQVSRQDLTESTANIQNPCTNTKSLISPYLPSANGTRTVSLQAIPNTYPNFDDNFTKEIEMCVISKPCDTCKHTQVNDDLKSARIEYKLTTTTTREPSISKTIPHHPPASRRSSKVLANRHSCCSICCKDGRYLPTNEPSRYKIASPLNRNTTQFS